VTRPSPEFSSHVSPGVHVTGSAARRWPRGRPDEVARLHAFSDGVFAFAATLLVVNLRIPDSYDDLLTALGRVPALALAFAAVVSLWAIHRGFFSRYPLADTWSVALNAVLLFVVLIYVYPLKLLVEVTSARVLGVQVGTLGVMAATDVERVYMIFGAAVIATCVVLAALHLRAWQLRETLGLDALGRVELVAGGATYVGIAIMAGVASGIAALGIGTAWGLPVWILLTVSPLLELARTTYLRRRAPGVRQP